MSDLDRAIELYVAYRTLSYPKEDGSRVIESFGSAKGEQLLADVQHVLNEFEKQQPDWSKRDLESGSRWAAEQVRDGHPELTPDAVVALAWTCSYW